MANKTLQNKNRHAYMIICHNNFEQLCLLLNLLDDERNDIYIHVDKKVKEPPFQMLKEAVRRSGLYFTKRVEVTWGGYSQVLSELSLLEAVAEGGYGYCHFLSGIDLPIKSQDYIHAFFDSLEGKQCVSFERIENVLDRVRYYYPFQDAAGRKQGKFPQLLRKLQDFLVRLQRKLGFSRIKGREEMFYEGANWVSVTGDFAAYIVKNRALARKLFRWTHCADELFVQTMLMNSPFKDHVHRESTRFIDWQRGRPYTFTAEDFELLMGSDKLFARKFEAGKDAEIIRLICERLK